MNPRKWLGYMLARKNEGAIELPAPITDINLKLIQTFILVATHLSFRYVADLTFRSQSAVSNQIKQLEEQVGVTLFRRTTRKVRLTPEGQQLLEGAHLAIRTIDASVREIRETIDIRRGRVMIACSPTIASARLAKILSLFEDHYPSIRVIVREQNPPDLFNSVRGGEVDFAIGPVIKDPELSFQVILKERLFAIVPRTLLPTTQKAVTVTQLATMPLLLLNRASALRELLNQAFNSVGIELQTKFEFSQAQTLISMANAGLGAAILPKCVVPSGTNAKVQVLAIREPSLARDIALITRKGYVLSPASGRLALLSQESIDRLE
ncbi:LysR family transcriptional regulator [Bradyrhizobium tunisiense]|uniref:LysR family transcriptional regulator n=1 Tax=Bradyrhizobium tunisiense TaxID=3278709 RepID=UPI0035DE9D47